MTDEQIVASLVRSIKLGNYKVTITEPNNIELRTADDGSEFLVAYGDSERFGVFFGSCKVVVRKHAFNCNLETGEWTAESSSDSWLLDEDDFMQAMEYADGVFFGDCTDLEAERDVWCAANGKDTHIDIYMSGYEPLYDCGDIEIEVSYCRYDGCEPETVTCCIDEDDAQDLYDMLTEEGELNDDEIIVEAFEVEDNIPDLNDKIMGQIRNETGNDLWNYEFTLSKDFFSDVIGETED